MKPTSQMCQNYQDAQHMEKHIMKLLNRSKLQWKAGLKYKKNEGMKSRNHRADRCMHRDQGAKKQSLII